jgi:hypothetical protein
MFKDETFCNIESQYYYGDNNEGPIHDFEFVRASKLPCFTNDDGDVNWVAGYRLSPEGEEIMTRCYNEYAASKYSRPMMEAIFLNGNAYLDTSIGEGLIQASKDHGLYAVYLWAKGKSTEVVVDDFILTYYYEPLYGMSDSHAAWISIIEKALAKLNGYNYKILYSNDPTNIGDGFNLSHWKTNPGNLITELTHAPTLEHRVNELQY